MMYTEMMTVMYNYIRVDTTNFLSNTSYVEVVIEMAKAVRSLSLHFESGSYHNLLDTDR